MNYQTKLLISKSKEMFAGSYKLQTHHHQLFQGRHQLLKQHSCLGTNQEFFLTLIKILGKGWGRQYSSPLLARMLHGGSGGALVANILFCQDCMHTLYRHEHTWALLFCIHTVTSFLLLHWDMRGELGRSTCRWWSGVLGKIIWWWKSKPATQHHHLTYYIKTTCGGASVHV